MLYSSPLLTIAVSVLVSLPISLAAQSIGSPQSVNCPIQVRAIPVASIHHETPHGPVHQINLALKGREAHTVRFFRGAIHGPQAEGSTKYALDAAGDLILPFHTPGADSNIAVIQLSVWTGPVTSVRWIEFYEIVFTDGSEWHSSRESTCQFVPEAPRDSTELTPLD